jgi:hypothetical protein
MRVLGFELLRLVPAASQAPAADGRSSCGPMQEGCPRLRTGNRIRSRQPKCPRLQRDSNGCFRAQAAARHGKVGCCCRASSAFETRGNRLSRTERDPVALETLVRPGRSLVTGVVEGSSSRPPRPGPSRGCSVTLGAGAAFPSHVRRFST